MRKPEVQRFYIVPTFIFEARMALRQMFHLIFSSISLLQALRHIIIDMYILVFHETRTNGRSYEADWKLQTFSCSSARISSSMKKATLMIFSYISMKKPLLEVGKLEGMFVKSCWWLSGDSTEIQYSIRSRFKYQGILRSVDNA